MFDEEPKKKPQGFQKLDSLSVQELEDYIIELQGEIERARADITRKKASQSAADSIFKV